MFTYDRILDNSMETEIKLMIARDWEGGDGE